jgi:hypothetical protein
MLEVTIYRNSVDNVYHAFAKSMREIKATAPTINAVERSYVNKATGGGYSGQIRFLRPNCEVWLGADETRELQV